jgi:hypothetical protein
VATGAKRPGFAYIGIALPDLVHVPAWKGADPTVSDQSRLVNMNAEPLLQFENNEAYGACEDALLFWAVGALDTRNVVFPGAAESQIRDFRGWHFFRAGVFPRFLNHATFDHIVFLGNGKSGRSTGWDALGGRVLRAITLRNWYCGGLATGIVVPQMPGAWSEAAPPIFLIEDSVLHCDRDVVFEPINFDTSGVFADVRLLPPRRTELTHVQLLGGGLVFDREFRRVRDGEPVDNVYNVVQCDQVIVDGAQVFAPEQAPSALVPQTLYSAQQGGFVVWGVPEAGLTNAQAWAKYGLAVCGEVAPEEMP